jgi:hypothetical protein
MHLAPPHWKAFRPVHSSKLHHLFSRLSQGPAEQRDRHRGPNPEPHAQPRTPEFRLRHLIRTSGRRLPATNITSAQQGLAAPMPGASMSSTSISTPLPRSPPCAARQSAAASCPLPRLAAVGTLLGPSRVSVEIPSDFNHPAWCSRAQFRSTSPLPMASNAPSIPSVPM